MTPGIVTAALRNTLWSAIIHNVEPDQYENVTFNMWLKFFKLPIDARPTLGYAVGGRKYEPSWQYVRDQYFAAKWHQVFDYVEYFIHSEVLDEELVNAILEREAAAYRTIDGMICEVTDAGEIATINQALALEDKFKPVADHFRTAAERLSDRINPDYRNSIKESISGVEAMAQIVSGGKADTLGRLLSRLERDQNMNGALKTGFSSIYGWTSDDKGIRHAMAFPDQQPVNQADAKFFLIACSAFANYLKTFDLV